MTNIQLLDTVISANKNQKFSGDLISFQDNDFNTHLLKNEQQVDNYKSKPQDLQSKHEGYVAEKSAHAKCNEENVYNDRESEPQKLINEDNHNIGTIHEQIGNSNESILSAADALVDIFDVAQEPLFLQDAGSQMQNDSSVNLITDEDESISLGALNNEISEELYDHHEINETNTVLNTAGNIHNHGVIESADSTQETEIDELSISLSNMSLPTQESNAASITAHISTDDLLINAFIEESDSAELVPHNADNIYAVAVENNVDLMQIADDVDNIVDAKVLRQDLMMQQDLHLLPSKSEKVANDIDPVIIENATQDIKVVGNADDQRLLLNNKNSSVNVSANAADKSLISEFAIPTILSLHAEPNESFNNIINKDINIVKNDQQIIIVQDVFDNGNVTKVLIDFESVKDTKIFMHSEFANTFNIIEKPYEPLSVVFHSNNQQVMPDIDEQINVAINIAINKGQKAVIVEMHPANLGKIKVILTNDVSNKINNVRFIVEQKDTLQLLINNAEKLEFAWREIPAMQDASLKFNLQHGGSSYDEYQAEQHKVDHSSSFDSDEMSLNASVNSEDHESASGIINLKV